MQPRFKPACNALLLRHTTKPRRMVHDPFAFAYGKLTQEKISLSWCSGEPIWVSTSSIEKGRLCRSGCLLCEFDEFVFYFEGAQRFEASKVQGFHNFLRVIS